MARRILIVGNGVAGVSAALTLRARDDSAEITLLSDESDYFFSRTALMYALMDKLPRRAMEPYERKVWDKQNIQRVRARVTNLDADAHTVTLDDNRTLAYDILILATGSAPRPLPLEGDDAVREGRVHFVTLQDLDACERLVHSTARAVVVGGGLIGIELVESLLWHKIQTTFVVREGWYWPAALCREEGAMVADHMRAHGVTLVTDDEVRAVHADANGRVKSVQTKNDKTVACELLGVAIGVVPNVRWLSETKPPPALGRGIRVDERLQTSLPDVYAIGDCAEVIVPNKLDANGEAKRKVESIWYAAKRQGEFVARGLSGAHERYAPPRFFNSAKFFEVEYTTVGDWEDIPEGAESVLLRLPGKTVSARLVHDGSKFIAFNALGSRWDTPVLDQWMDEGRSLEWVRRHLHEAQFDVEFGRAPLRKMQETVLEARP